MMAFYLGWPPDGPEEDWREPEPEQPYPEPTDEELCEAYGHMPAEEVATRCYCGAVHYGPITIGRHADAGMLP